MNRYISSPIENKYLAMVFVFIFINTYLELPLGLGASSYIPSFFLLLSVALAWFSVRRHLEGLDYRYIFWIFVFCVFSAFLAPNYSDLDSRFFGVLQMLTSSLTFVVVFSFLRNLNEEYRGTIFLWVVRILVFLTFLEYVGLTTSISDSFRNAVYGAGGYVAYDGDVRDLMLGDFIRPKVFSSEPSLVAIGFFVSAIGSAWALRENRIIIELVVLTAVEYYLLNSPILFLVPVCIFPVFKARNIYVFISVLLCSGALFIISFGSGPDFSERFERFSPDVIFSTETALDAENEKSERLRIVYPYISAMDAISVNPISGFGISGKRSLAIYSSISPLYEIAMGNNAFASVFVFFGAFGAIVFFGLIFNYLKSYGSPTFGLLLCCFCFMQTMGALESARFWSYFAMIVASTLAYDSKKAQ